MRLGEQELYAFTKKHFLEELKRIRPECVSPIIAIRRVVRTAIYKYSKDNGSVVEELVSEATFQKTSNLIHSEIMNGTL